MFIAFLGASALVLVLLAVAVLLVLRRRMVAVTVEGSSMEPAYTAGDRVLVRRVPFGLIRAGQAVVIERPEPGGWVGPPDNRRMAARNWMIKRVVACPGDPVSRDDFPVLADQPGTWVPADRLLVRGDNPGVSYDSRHVGYIPAERVLGVVARRIG